MSLHDIVTSEGLSFGTAVASILGAIISIVSAGASYFTYRRFKNRVAQKLRLRNDTELETKTAELVEIVRPIGPYARQSELRGISTRGISSHLQQYYALVTATISLASASDDRLTDSKRKVASDLKDAMNVLAEQRVGYEKIQEAGKNLYYSIVDFGARLKQENERRLLSL